MVKGWESVKEEAPVLFSKHKVTALSIKEYLEQFYFTCDNNNLRWNHSDILIRVTQKFVGENNKTIKWLELNEEHYHIFFPVNDQDIIRYHRGSL
ncbi:alpha 1,4-glycosyltransferase family protein [Trifolium repens]|nr:alpha 1,4-glycosyltransferase family protein [Trifolium repens]